MRVVLVLALFFPFYSVGKESDSFSLLPEGTNLPNENQTMGIVNDEGNIKWVYPSHFYTPPKETPAPMTPKKEDKPIPPRAIATTKKKESPKKIVKRKQVLVKKEKKHQLKINVSTIEKVGGGSLSYLYSFNHWKVGIQARFFLFPDKDTNIIGTFLLGEYHPLTKSSLDPYLFLSGSYLNSDEEPFSGLGVVTGLGLGYEITSTYKIHLEADSLNLNSFKDSYFSISLGISASF